MILAESEMELLHELLFTPAGCHQSPPSTTSPSQDYCFIKPEEPSLLDYENAYRVPYQGKDSEEDIMSKGQHGNYWGDEVLIDDPFIGSGPGSDDEELWDTLGGADCGASDASVEDAQQEEGAWSSADGVAGAIPYTVEDFSGHNWDNALNPEGNDATGALPDYLLAAPARSPMPMDYDPQPQNIQEEAIRNSMIKQEPYSPTSRENHNDVALTGPFFSSTTPSLQSSQLKPDGKVKLAQRRAQATRRSTTALPKSRYSSTRPLVERQKRPSDDENDSISSVISDTPTDATDGSTASVNSNGALPSLPRISTVILADPVKRQRRDVSMSAPAVAARELRQKKKLREEELIAECQRLKVEGESLEKASTASQTDLEKLRQDALYLRSLVRSQQSTVALLEYLQKAPFFQGSGKELQLDGRSMLRQISGSHSPPGSQKDALPEEDGVPEIGGVCLHINGSNITLHLCSHCSTEASAT